MQLQQKYFAMSVPTVVKLISLFKAPRESRVNRAPFKATVDGADGYGKVTGLLIPIDRSCKITCVILTR